MEFWNYSNMKRNLWNESYNLSPSVVKRLMLGSMDGWMCCYIPLPIFVDICSKIDIVITLLLQHKNYRDPLSLVVNLLKKKNTTGWIVHHVSGSRNMLQFWPSSLFFIHVAVLCIYVLICTKDVTILSTFKKTARASPSMNLWNKLETG